MSICVFVYLSVCPYHRKTPTFCGQKLIFASDDTFKKIHFNDKFNFSLLFLKTQNYPKSKIKKTKDKAVSKPLVLVFKKKAFHRISPLANLV